MTDLQVPDPHHPQLKKDKQKKQMIWQLGTNVSPVNARSRQPKVVLGKTSVSKLNIQNPTRNDAQSEDPVV